MQLQVITHNSSSPIQFRVSLTTRFGCMLRDGQTRPSTNFRVGGRFVCEVFTSSTVCRCSLIILMAQTNQQCWQLRKRDRTFFCCFFLVKRSDLKTDQKDLMWIDQTLYTWNLSCSSFYSNLALVLPLQKWKMEKITKPFLLTKIIWIMPRFKRKKQTKNNNAAICLFLR